MACRPILIEAQGKNSTVFEETFRREAYRVNVHAMLRFLSRAGLGKFFLLRQLGEAVYSLRPEIVEVQGHKLLLDSSDCLTLSSQGAHEPTQTRLIIENVKPGDVVVDIGAHIGYYTLLFAKLVGESGKVIAFEPEPRNFSLLERNVKMNGYRNVTLVQKAVSDRSGKMRLYLCQNNQGMHSLYKTPDLSGFVEVEAVRLDDYFKIPASAGMTGGVKVDFVKIDAEGADYSALLGMTRVLQENEKLKLCTEFHWSFEPYGVDSEKYLKFLEDHRFRLYEIDEDEGSVDPVSRTELLKKARADDYEFTNLFCVREPETVTT